MILKLLGLFWSTIKVGAMFVCDAQEEARFMCLPSLDVCVCVISFYDDKTMGTRITLSQLDAAAPESSYTLGDKAIGQPALSQTLVGHSVIVVRHVCRLVGKFISRHLRGLPPRRFR